MSKDVEFGLDTFGDVTLAPDGKFLPQAQVIRNVIAEAELADRLGIDFSALASTTVLILLFLRLKWRSRRLPRGPVASASVRP